MTLMLTVAMQRTAGRAAFMLSADDQERPFQPEESKTVLGDSARWTSSDFI